MFLKSGAKDSKGGSSRQSSSRNASSSSLTRQREGELLEEIKRAKNDAAENERRVDVLTGAIEEMKEHWEKKDMEMENLQAEAKKVREIESKLESESMEKGKLMQLLRVKSDENKQLEDTMKEVQEANRVLRSDLENTVSDQLAKRLHDERENLLRDAGRRTGEMASEIEDLTRKVNQRDKSIQALQADIGTFQQKLKGYSKREDESQARINRLQKELSDQAKTEKEDKSEIRKLQQQLQDLANLLEQKVKEEIPALQQEVTDQNRRLATSEIEAKELQKKAKEQEILVDARKEVQDLKQEVDEQRKRVAAFVGEVAKREQLLNERKKLLEASTLETQKVQREAEQQRQLAAAFKKEVQDLQEVVDHQKQLTDEQKEVLVASKLEAQKVQREVLQQRQLAAASKTQTQELQRENQRLQMEVEEQRELVGRSKTEIQRIQQEADKDRERIVSTSKIEITEKEDQLQRLSEEEKKRLQNQLDYQKKETEAFEQKRNEGGKHASKRVKELELELQTQLKWKKDSDKLYNTARIKLLNNIHEKALDIKRLQTTIHQKDGEIERMNQRRKVEKKKSEIEVEDKEALLQKQKDRCTQLQEKCDRYQDENEDLKELLEKSRQLGKRGDFISELVIENTKLEQQNRALEQRVSTQESKVMQAQEAAMDMLKMKEALRYKFLPHSFVHSEMYASLEMRPEEWARKYAARHFNPTTTTSSASPVFEKVLISTASPHIALLVLLIQYITEHVLMKPFLRLGVSESEDLAVSAQKLYERFQKVDGKSASAWRSQTLEIISSKWRRNLDLRVGKSQDPEWVKLEQKRVRARATEGIDEFPFPASEDLAGSFINGPAAVLLEHSGDNEHTKRRRASLAEVIRESAWISFMLWRQRAQVDLGGYDEWKDIKYSANIVDGHWSQLHPKNFLSSDAQVGIILQPSITASWMEDGKEKIEVWRKAVGLWRNCAFNNIVDDVSEESEEDSEDDYTVTISSVSSAKSLASGMKSLSPKPSIARRKVEA